MQLSDLQTQVGVLTNDPNNTRYALADVTQELNNTQRQWNAEIKIIKTTTTIAIVAGNRQYSLQLLTGTPISFPRVTQNGRDLKKRSKSYFDLYTSYDWTLINGTPTDFFIEATDPQGLFVTVYPNPTGNDVPTNLVVEAVVDTTDMALAADTPYTSPYSTQQAAIPSNYLCRPYDFYIAYSAAARLLARDPSPENSGRASQYLTIASEGKDLLINVFKQLEASEPLRMQGGRQW